MENEIVATDTVASTENVDDKIFEIGYDDLYLIGYPEVLIIKKGMDVIGVLKPCQAITLAHSIMKGYKAL